MTINSGATASFNADQHLASLSIPGGSATVADNGARVIATNALSVTSGGKLDLRDNNLVVHNGTLGAWNGSAYTGVTGLVQSGRNQGTWDGPGIVTTQSDAAISSQLTTIAIASNIDLGRSTFDGQSVGPTDVLAMYTYAGDANLDGVINADDYFQIDSHYSQPSSALNYFKGDFNYDGVINGDDYFLIDTNYAAQTGSLAPSAGFVSAVPEPAAPLALWRSRCSHLAAGAALPPQSDTFSRMIARASSASCALAGLLLILSLSSCDRSPRGPRPPPSPPNLHLKSSSSRSHRCFPIARRIRPSIPLETSTGFRKPTEGMMCCLSSARAKCRGSRSFPPRRFPRRWAHRADAVTFRMSPPAPTGKSTSIFTASWGQIARRIRAIRSADLEDSDPRRYIHSRRRQRHGTVASSGSWPDRL